MTYMDLQQNIDSIKRRIANAAASAGRKPEDIRLIAVSKTVDAAVVRQAYELGLDTFGENRPQEIRDKSAVIPEAKWHMIGRLQTNKLKYVVGKTELIHSVDTMTLMQDINEFAKKLEIVQDILIQINISGEESKAGIRPEDFENMLECAVKLNNIRVLGIMTIGSKYASEYELEKMFENCRKIFVDNSVKKYDNIDIRHLSMGMSGDFETAIKHGSTMVRIGSAIFGERKYV